jgi:hypothetical protein
MYSNIDTEHGLEVIGKWFKLHEHELPEDYPIETILAGLAIVMRNNVFAFGDTFWLQLCGTAMGTSVACMYATVYYSYHEETKINPPSPHFKHVRILLNKRFIDDAYFVVTTHDTQASKIELVETMNDFAGATGKSLEWEVSDLAKSVDFLDLTLTIDATGRIICKTFQKAMNLYLYIPRMSAHPKSVFDSFIAGQIRRYWLQNTLHSDFTIILGLFLERLLQRGYPFDETANRFRQVCADIDANPPNLPEPKRIETAAPDATAVAERQLFLHAKYHPEMTASKEIHRAYRDSFGDDGPLITKEENSTATTKKTRLTIAFARAPNIGDLTVRTTLTQKEGHPRVSKFISRVCQHDAPRVNPPGGT